MDISVWTGLLLRFTSGGISGGSIGRVRDIAPPLVFILVRQAGNSLETPPIALLALSSAPRQTKRFGHLTLCPHLIACQYMFQKATVSPKRHVISSMALTACLCRATLLNINLKAVGYN